MPASSAMTTGVPLPLSAAKPTFTADSCLAGALAAAALAAGFAEALPAGAALLAPALGLAGAAAELAGAEGAAAEPQAASAAPAQPVMASCSIRRRVSLSTGRLYAGSRSRIIPRNEPLPGLRPHWAGDAGRALPADVLAAGVCLQQAGSGAGCAYSRNERGLHAVSRGRRSGPHGGAPVRAPRDAAVNRLGGGRLHPLLLSRLEVRRVRPVCRDAGRGGVLPGQGADSELPDAGVPGTGVRLPWRGRGAGAAALRGLRGRGRAGGIQLCPRLQLLQ